ncbi:MAG: CpsD/CapB family tyrosine-protein kinase, partial [Oscillospiraceae bacterium]|nr:CpsD/CapB family tyrosine-protein kinase [Oscillospiraceae bacterium]
IDGDMRRSNLARRLNVVNSPGLSNYIIDTSLSGIIRSTELSKNLYVIPAGDFPPNPSELLGSEMMKRVIEYLSKNFEYIVFDLPPVQAVADPLVASRFLDGVIVVARDKITRKGELKDTIRQLSFVNANILGVVYNGVGDSSAGRKRKYYNHYYKYGKYYTSSGGDTSKPKSEEQK